MLDAILKGLRLAAPGLAIAVLGAIGVEVGREIGRGLGKRAADRIWATPAAPQPAAAPAKKRRASKRSR